MSEWVPFVGQRGGQGWQNSRTGEVRYQDECPDGSGAAPEQPAQPEPPSQPDEQPDGQPASAEQEQKEEYPPEVQEAIRDWQENGTRSQVFKNWFGDWEGDPENASKVIDPRTHEPAETIQYSKVVDEDGNPLIVKHGTTHDFEAFGYDNANIENDMGTGFYFSTSADDVDSNYAGEGPDLTGRIEQFVERVADDDKFRWDFDEKIEEGELDPDTDFDDYVHDLARKELVGDTQRVISAYLNIRKPVVLQANEGHRKGGTIFELELIWEDDQGRSPEDPDYDEDSAEVVDEGGSAIDLMNAMQSCYYNYEGWGDQWQDAWQELADYADSGISAYDVYTAIKKHCTELMDDEGNWAVGEYTQEVFRELGHDGVHYRNAKSFFPGMEGVTEDTDHWIAFSPEQVKSVDNLGTFNPKDNRYRYERRYHSARAQWHDAKAHAPEGVAVAIQQGNAIFAFEEDKDEVIRYMKGEPTEREVVIAERYRQHPHDQQAVGVANATSRSSGMIGPNAVVPRIVEKLVDKSSTILDFSAGKTAAHAERRKGSGYDVTAYDYGGNQGELHDPDALSKTYDVVFASNVLNVQDSDEELKRTVQEIAESVAAGGVVIANLPSEPRKGAFNGTDPEDATSLVRNLLAKHFQVVEVVSGGNTAPVFVASNDQARVPDDKMKYKQSDWVRNAFKSANRNPSDEQIAAWLDADDSGKQASGQIPEPPPAPDASSPVLPVDESDSMDGKSTSLSAPFDTMPPLPTKPGEQAPFAPQEAPQQEGVAKPALPITPDGFEQQPPMAAVGMSQATPADDLIDSSQPPPAPQSPEVPISGTADSEWVPYVGESGGQGFQNTRTGEVRYQDEAPIERGAGEPQAPTDPISGDAVLPGGEQQGGQQESQEPVDIMSTAAAYGYQPKDPQADAQTQARHANSYVLKAAGLLGYKPQGGSREENAQAAARWMHQQSAHMHDTVAHAESHGYQYRQDVGLAQNNAGAVRHLLNKAIDGGWHADPDLTADQNMQAALAHLNEASGAPVTESPQSSANMLKSLAFTAAALGAMYLANRFGGKKTASLVSMVMGLAAGLGWQQPAAENEKQQKDPKFRNMSMRAALQFLRASEDLEADKQAAAATTTEAPEEDEQQRLQSQRQAALEQSEQLAGEHTLPPETISDEQLEDMLSPAGERPDEPEPPEQAAEPEPEPPPTDQPGETAAETDTTATQTDTAKKFHDDLRAEIMSRLEALQPPVETPTPTAPENDAALAEWARQQDSAPAEPSNGLTGSADADPITGEQGTLFDIEEREQQTVQSERAYKDEQRRHEERLNRAGAEELQRLQEEANAKLTPEQREARDQQIAAEEAARWEQTQAAAAEAARRKQEAKSENASAMQKQYETTLQEIFEDEEDRNFFRDYYDQFYADHKDEVDRHNSLIEHAGGRGDIVRRLRAGEDPDNILRFDELVQIAESHYPEALHWNTGSMSGKGDAEAALANFLIQGKRTAPPKYDRDLIQAAIEDIEQKVGFPSDRRGSQPLDRVSDADLEAIPFDDDPDYDPWEDDALNDVSDEELAAIPFSRRGERQQYKRFTTARMNLIEVQPGAYQMVTPVGRFGVWNASPGGGQNLWKVAELTELEGEKGYDVGETILARNTLQLAAEAIQTEIVRKKQGKSEKNEQQAG